MNSVIGYTFAFLFWATVVLAIARWEGPRPTEYINWDNYAHAFTDHTK